MGFYASGYCYIGSGYDLLWLNLKEIKTFYNYDKAMECLYYVREVAGSNPD